MTNEFIHELATYDPVQVTLKTMAALRQARSQKTLQALNELKLKQEPQAFQTAQGLAQAQTSLAQSQAASAPTKAHLASLLQELQIENLSSKIHQAKTAADLGVGGEAFEKKDAAALGTALPDLSKSSESATAVKNNLLQMKKLYDRMPSRYKGAMFGHIPAAITLNPDVQEFERLKADLVINKMGDMKGNRGSDLLRKWIVAGKISRNLDPAAFLHAFKQGTSISDRTIEKNKFFNKMATQGISGYSKISRPWSEYIANHPVTDPNTGDILEQNIGKWGDYATPDAAKAAQNNQYIMPPGSNPPTIPSVHGKVAQQQQEFKSISESQIVKLAKELGISVEEAKQLFRSRGVK